MPGRRGSDPDAPSAPGWYPDPWSATGEGMRYFDGKKWGSSEKPLGRESTVASLDTQRRVRRRRSGRERAPLIIGIVVVVAATLVLAQFRSGGGGGNSTSRQTQATTVATDRPPPSKEERARPLGAPAPVPPGTGRFEILRTQRNAPAAPVAFDPCRPVHYVTNLDGAPSDAATLIHDAIARVQTATGLQFVDDGTTTELPNKDRIEYQPARYGARWAPVLIAWSDETAYPELAGYIEGLGEPDAVFAAETRLVYVTGQVVLDRQQLAPAALPDRALARAVILHELGHLVGLDHTSDRSQLMFSESEFNVKDYGDGDLRGLAQLGTQACFPGV